MHVFLDESGNFHPTKPLIVGGAITPSLPEVEQAVVELYELWSQAPHMEGLDSFDAFVQEGFHYSANPLEIQNLFVDAMTRLGGFRVFMAFSDRTRMEQLSDIERAKVLYGALLPDIISSARTSELCLVFESNRDLNSWFPKLVANATLRASHNSKRRIPTVSYRIEDKGFRPLALIDYAMAIVSNWIDTGFERNPSKFQYRHYRAIEKNIAMIYDFDNDRRSTRAHRDFQ